MKGRPWLVAIVAAVGACMVLTAVCRRSEKELSTARAELVHYTNLAGNLRKQAGDAESERDSADRTIRELRRKVASLREQRKGDSLLLGALWGELDSGIRGTDKPVWYDWETIKNMLTSSESNQEGPLTQILTAEGIQATLEDHKGDPTYWVAAASLVQDEDAAFRYLEEAAKLYPKSAVVLSSLIEALMTRGQFNETTAAHIAQLKEVDPANCLPDYYDAYCRLQSGDVQGALKCLAEGAVKDRFADNGMELLMARYNYLSNAGCSDGAAMGLSAFTLPFYELAMLRDVGRGAMEQAGAYVSTGQYQEALRIADAVVRMGSNLSSSGRFLVFDLVGIALRRSALNEQRSIYEGLGNVVQIDEIDSQLRAITERLSLIKAMGGSFDNVLQNMTEQEIATFVERTIRSGEFSTLLDMPGVAESLEQARNPQQ